MSIKILVVDDEPNLEPLIKQIFRKEIRKKRFEFIFAENGLVALDKLRNNHEIDVVLSDIRMPKMDGLTMLAELKKLKSTLNPLLITTVIVSAYDDIDNIRKAMNGGAFDFLTKPIDHRDMRITVEKTVQHSQQLRKAIEQKDLAEKELKKLSSVVEQTVDNVVITDNKGIIEYVNPAFEKLTGHSKDELIGKTQNSIRPEQYSTQFYEQVWKKARDGEVLRIEIAIENMNGESYQEETVIAPIRDEQDNITHFVSIGRDITERKQVEAERLKLATYLAKLNKAYERFVPREFFGFLKKEDITTVQLGDQVQRKMTIMFSDIRGFASLSEQMTPQENFNFLNSYLSHVSPVIRANNGFIDKYIGDAIMALFPDQSNDAMQAAIGMCQKVAQYNLHRKEQGYQPISIGMGMHTGNVMLGIVGELERVEVTAISNAVNLASRLEGLTKLYGASIVVSESTLFSLDRPAQYNFRFLDKVRVVGKQDPVSVFEIFDGSPEKVIELKLKTRTDFEKGLLYYHSQEFAEATEYFKLVLTVDPEDRAAQLYLRRAAHFTEYGVPVDWEGIEALTEK